MFRVFRGFGAGGFGGLGGLDFGGASRGLRFRAKPGLNPVRTGPEAGFPL